MIGVYYSGLAHLFRVSFTGITTTLFQSGGLSISLFTGPRVPTCVRPSLQLGCCLPIGGFGMESSLFGLGFLRPSSDLSLLVYNAVMRRAPMSVFMHSVE